MARLLALLFIFLLLSGCSASSTSAPTAGASVSHNQAPSSTPRPDHTREPTDVPTPTIAQASPLPTRLSAATPTSPSTPTPAPTETPALAPILSSYPIGMPGKPPGDGFFIRHGYAAENTWYNPGYWHTGEDWYAIDGDTAGARVYAIADGQVVYAGANYPGRVVVIRHAADRYSMYGHLDPSLNVRSGQQLARGELIGTVLRRGDATPNHLHFEVRVFLTTSAVNGDRPRYPFRCGRNCPPGPGYWPIEAPDHPSALGWRNTTHVIAHRMVDTGGPLGEAVVATKPISPSVTLWSAPPDDSARAALGELELRPGERFPLLEIRPGLEDSRGTSALAYQLWYRIRQPDGRAVWVQAAIPSTFETGADGRPSSVYLNFFPAN